MEQMNAPLLIPAQSEAQAFLDVLEPRGRFTFQTFDDNADRKDPNLARVFHGTLNEHWEALTGLNRRGAGVFVCVNETDLCARKADNITRVRAIFVDLDGAPIEPVLKHDCEPTMVIESSAGRWHAYYCASNVPLDEFTKLQKAVCARFDGDPSCVDLPRVMRLPGFVHHKVKNGVASPPFMTRIEETLPEVRYERDQLAAFFAMEEARTAPPPVRGVERVSDHDQLREALQYIDPANREDWVAVGHGLKADNPNNLPLFLSFSRGDYWGKKPDNYVDDADVIYAWNGFQPSRSGVNTVIALAIRRGYHPTSSRAPLRLGSPVEVARIMLDETQKADGIAPVHSEGSFWRYNGAFWGEWAPSEMRTTIHTFDGAKADRGRLKIGSSFVDGVLKELAAMVHDQNFFSEASIGLNLRNGFARYLAAGGVDLGPHSPDHRQRFALPHDFCVPPAEIPDGHIQTFLHGCFGRDNTSFHQLILEVIGAALSGMNTRMKAPKAFVLHGVTAANGKSTLQAIIRAILPKGVICSVAPADLGDPQFLASLAGKQVNLSDELSGSKAIASDRFKAVITGDPVQAKIVYREPFTFTPSAVHVFAANVLPSFAGGVDNGLKRRLVVIPFGRSIPEQDRIPDLAEKIVERQGGLLISMALQAASEAFAAGIYTIPKDCAEATEQWFVDVDPVHEWYEDGGLQAHVSKNGMLLKDLYVKFREDGASHGLRFLPSKRRFVQRIRQLIDEDPEWRIVRRKNGEAVVPAALL